MFERCKLIQSLSQNCYGHLNGVAWCRASANIDTQTWMVVFDSELEPRWLRTPKRCDSFQRLRHGDCGHLNGVFWLGVGANMATDIWMVYFDWEHEPKRLRIFERCTHKIQEKNTHRESNHPMSKGTPGLEPQGPRVHDLPNRLIIQQSKVPEVMICPISSSFNRIGPRVQYLSN